MIDVNMLPRELTGYVGHVCGLWFGSYFIDFEPVFVHSTAGIIGELYEYLVDTVQDNSMNGGLDYEDAEEYAKLAATVPWSMEEIDRVAEQSFRYVSDRTLQVAYALCVLTFDAMFPQKIEVVKPDVRETLLSVAFPHDWQRRMAESDHDRVSAYRMGLEWRFDDVWIEGRFSRGTGTLRHQSEDACRPFRQCRVDGETLGEAWRGGTTGRRAGMVGKYAHAACRSGRGRVGCGGRD